MRLRGIAVSIPPAIVRACETEADALFPLETGGVLMGYWASDDLAVVSAMIGPGPAAVHRSHSFEPDLEWQHGQIATHYFASGRRETYLGDWHTHPHAQSGSLSRHDRQVIRTIIRTPEARAKRPLMAIFHGTPREWGLTIWLGTTTRTWFGMTRLSVIPLRRRQ